MATAAALQSKPTYVSKAKLYLLRRQALVSQELERFLNDEGALFTTDTEQAAEVLAEIAGRTCHMSFGKGRKSNQEYLENILSSKHGSVLEHAVWNLLITGVSRALTHELVRHRAGFGYSQLSQRYVDESEARYVVPPLYQENEELRLKWQQTIECARKAYAELAEAPRSTSSKSTRRWRRATGASGRGRLPGPSCPTPARPKSSSPAIPAPGATSSSCAGARTPTPKSACWPSKSARC